MGISGNDLIIAMRIVMETKQAVRNINSTTTAMNNFEKAANRANAAAKATGLTPIFTKSQIDSVKKANDAIKQLEPSSNKAGKGLFSLTNIIRTALGTLEAMAIFLVTRFIGQAIAKTIDSVKQLELSILNLAVAEKTLSRAGVEIDFKDFDKIKEAVRATGIAISEIDLTKLVANTATGFKDLGLTVQQIQDLAVAAAVIAFKEGKTVEDIQAQLQNGIATHGKGLKDIDIQVTAGTIKQKALDAQLVKNEEAWKNLTAEQKLNVEMAALILIVNDNVATSLEDIAILNDSVTKKSGILKEKWENLTTALGVTFAPLIKGGLDLLTKGVIGWGKSLEITKTLFEIWFASFVAGYFTIQEILAGNIRSFDEWGKAAARNYKVARQIVDSLFAPPQLPKGTPTGKSPSPIGEEGGGEDIAGATEKMEKEILESQIKFSQDMQDVAIDLGRKMVDITAEYARKRADAQGDFNKKVRDINEDYADDIQDIEAKQAETRKKSQNDQLEKEKEFQNKLQEMREDFLMALDDALHARDARQILRLIKQYNLEKLQAERKHGLDQENTERDNKLEQEKFVKERADAEKKRKRKIEDARQDYNDKLAKLKADEDAEVQAAVLAANRKIQDLEKNNADRLAMVAANLISEFNLTNARLNAIVSLYQKYYTDVSSIYSAMNAMMAGMGGLGMASGKVGATGKPASKAGGGGNFKKAQGGMMFADQPTSVTFGEGGKLEGAAFFPLGGGRDTSKVFSNMSSSGGDGGGKVSIELLLSPDLESRIVRNTLGKTAEVITRIQRTK